MIIIHLKAFLSQSYSKFIIAIISINKSQRQNVCRHVQAIKKFSTSTQKKERRRRKKSSDQNIRL